MSNLIESGFKSKVDVETIEDDDDKSSGSDSAGNKTWKRIKQLNHYYN